MNTNDHLDADAMELAHGLDRLAQAERSTADPGLEARIANATHGRLIAARAHAAGLSLAGTTAAPTRRFVHAFRLAAGLGLAAAVTLVMLNRGGPTPMPRPSEAAWAAVTDAEWSLVFTDTGTGALLTDADRIDEALRTWSVDDDSFEGGAL